jgi:hypothetical protein
VDVKSGGERDDRLERGLGVGLQRPLNDLDGPLSALYLGA